MTSLPEIKDPELERQYLLLCSASKFANALTQRRPGLLEDLLDSGDLQRSYSESELAERLRTALQGIESRDALGSCLRQLRQREILRVLWRDFNRLAGTMETTRDMSLLAECCIEQAQSWLHRELAQVHGEPRNPQGSAQQLLVIAMGKLGARELNLSSDVDLIFAYPESGDTDGDVKPLSNQEFFTKLGQRLIAALDQVTAEGFVFRVDMRLRPYGDSGALVLNFAALEEYYQDQGRDWERYAFIKAGVITGEPRARKQLVENLRPFIYRRYIDFGVIESLRGMKEMINAEIRRKGLQDNIKLGAGGIREVEFIAQCFQLIRGGRSIALQQRELLPVLDTCESEGCLPGEAVSELKAAYLFLRDTEHAIQGWDDKQSQSLPSDAQARQALVTALGFSSWDAFSDVLAQHRARVSDHFAALIAAPADESVSAEVASPWPEDLSAAALVALGFSTDDAGELLAQLLEFRDSSRLRFLQTESRERLDDFMPRLLSACAKHDKAADLIARILPMVRSVVRRSAYLVLLLENPAALDELVQLCAASPWISGQLARQPVLLDELLDSRSLYSSPDKDILSSQLRQEMSRLDPEDQEANMEALRYFHAARHLHIAASEVSGRLPLMQVSDKLSYLAEVIVERALSMAWRDLVEKHGQPEREGPGLGFLVLGYGKLGGLELGHGSDLDLVFVYDAKPQGSTDGKRPLENSVFYTRLGQRLIHVLSTRTPMGQLYEVDMRLRPSGESGLLVSSLTAFREYQLNSAWTWEHQALVRARVIAGDGDLVENFIELRSAVLCQRRAEAGLAEEVKAMREKMREHLLPASADRNGQFHLKQGRGGIVDIEFMVQYAVLAWSHRCPALTAWSDNVRILETLQREGLFTEAESRTLTEAYIAYRSVAHQLALQEQDAVVDADRFVVEQAAVRDIWNELLGAKA